MKILEHRRHSIRSNYSDRMCHLSQNGIELARSVKNLLGDYQIVVTSKLQRAMETAVALGHEITFTDSRLNTYGQAIEDISPYPFSFTKILSLLQDHQAFQKFATEQKLLYQQILDQLPSKGHALLVSHGGVIEIPLVAIFPDENHATWGKNLFSYCEGFRIYYDEEEKKFVRYELLRLD